METEILYMTSDGTIYDYMPLEKDAIEFILDEPLSGQELVDFINGDPEAAFNTFKTGVTTFSEMRKIVLEAEDEYNKQHFYLTYMSKKGHFSQVMPSYEDLLRITLRVGTNTCRFYLDEEISEADLNNFLNTHDIKTIFTIFEKGDMTFHRMKQILSSPDLQFYPYDTIYRELAADYLNVDEEDSADFEQWAEDTLREDCYIVGSFGCVKL